MLPLPLLASSSRPSISPQVGMLLSRHGHQTCGRWRDAWSSRQQICVADNRKCCGVCKQGGGRLFEAVSVTAGTSTYWQGANVSAGHQMGSLPLQQQQLAGSSLQGQLGGGLNDSGRYPTQVRIEPARPVREALTDGLGGHGKQD